MDPKEAGKRRTGVVGQPENPNTKGASKGKIGTESQRKRKLANPVAET